MSYLIAWGIYLLMGAALMLLFNRYFADFLGQGLWRLCARVLLAIVLFTPGFVEEDVVYVVPAWIGVFFNLLSHDKAGLIKSLLPLLLACAVVFGLLGLRELLRRRRPASQPAEVAEEEAADKDDAAAL